MPQFRLDGLPPRTSHFAVAAISPTHACNALSCSAFSWQDWLLPATVSATAESAIPAAAASASPAGDAVAGHPLATHFDAFFNWGSGDCIGNGIYRRPKSST
jgi:hypothetical protein